MPICEDCSLEFCNMKSSKCNKCQQLSGKSEVERKAIKAKGQCMACSLVYANLMDPLCRSCCIALSKVDEVPETLHHTTGALKQINEYQSRNSLATTLLSSAAIHQSKASDSRLTTHAEPKKIPARFGKPLTPSQLTAQAVKDERKAAKENALKIKIVAALWLTKVNKAGNTVMTKDPKVQFSVSVPEEQMAFDAIGLVIKDAQEFHKQSYPLANRLTRQDLALFAHQNASKYFRLSDRLLQDTSMNMRKFLNAFLDNTWISRTEWDKREIEIRLVCDHVTLFPNVTDDLEDSRLSMMPPVSGVRRSVSSSTGSNFTISESKRKLSSASAAVVSDGASVTKKHVRESAWNRKSRYSRNVMMITCKFVETIVTLTDDMDVVYKLSNKVKTIDIARDWEDGYRMCLDKEEYDGSGFVGMGSAKQVIYARFNGEDYALGQLKAGNSASENLKNLRGEYENLLYGEAIRASFTDLATKRQVGHPPFCFNAEGAIMGCFESENPPCDLPFRDFIATRLLPCSSIDKPIEKFTGHEDCGPPPAPTDALTTTLHAFTHYMIVYTSGEFVLCDLQGTYETVYSADVLDSPNLRKGMYNKAGILCLIDPQSHSDEKDNHKRHYWDDGPEGIKRILKQHLLYCSENIVCKGLDLRDSLFRGPMSPRKKTAPVTVKSEPNDSELSLRVGSPEVIEILSDSDSEFAEKGASNHRQVNGRLRVGE